MHIYIYVNYLRRIKRFKTLIILFTLKTTLMAINIIYVVLLTVLYHHRRLKRNGNRSVFFIFIINTGALLIYFTFILRSSFT